ncbi:MAG: hypothetical protein QW701_07115 [Candidatus Nezhaarchaeales archaeon]
MWIYRGVDMGKLNLTIEDEVERRFREAAFKKFGYKKGSLQKAVEEALNEWIQRNSGA